jgi:hypothetical protein
MSQYNYVWADFPNYAADADRLTNEILSSSITTVLSNVSVEDKCYIFFDSTLSGAEQTTLDNIITTHSGTSYNDPASASVEDEAEDSTTSTAYQAKVTLNLNDILGGTYLILWSASVKSSAANVDIRTRVQRNDIETLSEINWSPSTTGFGPLSGFVELTLDAGDHYFDFDYCTSSNNKEVNIRKARLIAIRT